MERNTPCTALTKIPPSGSFFSSVFAVVATVGIHERERSFVWWAARVSIPAP
jgi:hypothetical protein